jgi:hypothetical protein
MYICEDSEVLIDKASKVVVKNVTLDAFEFRWLCNKDNTPKLLLEYCVELADVCGIRNDKVNFGLLP